MAFRAFFALPVDKFSTVNGEPTNAVYGFTSMLANLLRDEAPTHVAVAFDAGRTTFRTEQYAEYKGTRDATPEPFRGQVALIREVLDAMRIPVLEKPNYEADDILATLADAGAGRRHGGAHLLGRPRHLPARHRRRHRALPGPRASATSGG